MLRKLKLKFICINMCIVTIMLIILFTLVISITEENIEADSIRMMKTITADPFRQGAPADGFTDVRLPYFALQVSKQGELVSNTDGFFDLSNQEMLRTIMERSLASPDSTGILEDYQLRFYRMSNVNDQLVIFADISSEQATMENLIQTCILIGILCFLIFLIISIFLARWAVKPVDKAWTRQKQFVTDASHELKTPLTVIMTNAELLQNPSFSAEEHQRFSDSILTMSQQMRSLVEGLLALARVDNDLPKTAFAPLDFSQITLESILSFEPLYFEKGRTLQYEVPENILVKGDAGQLQQAVDILLDNALKYSPEHSLVSITLQKDGKHCLLSVSNPGDPLTKEELSNIFKRFYRGDKARSMNESYGLGLSIALRIMENHHGKIWAENRNGFNCFFLQLSLSALER